MVVSVCAPTDTPSAGPAVTKSFRQAGLRGGIDRSGRAGAVSWPGSIGREAASATNA